MPLKEVPPAEFASTSSSSTYSQRRGVLIRDCIIGFADGLTVPFALTAGLSALGDTRLVIMGGLAELLAGSLSMGLGAFLAAITEEKHYKVEERRERRQLKEGPKSEGVLEVLRGYGISTEVADGVLEALKMNEDMWVQFKMDFELKLAKPSTKGWIEGCAMGIAYFLGGLLPMIPYFTGLKSVYHALFISIGITAVILVAFGYGKAIMTGTTRPEATWGAMQTLFVGAAAAGLSYGVVYGLNSVM